MVLSLRAFVLERISQQSGSGVDLSSLGIFTNLPLDQGLNECIVRTLDRCICR